MRRSSRPDTELFEQLLIWRVLVIVVNLVTSGLRALATVSSLQRKDQNTSSDHEDRDPIPKEWSLVQKHYRKQRHQ